MILFQVKKKDKFTKAEGMGYLWETEKQRARSVIFKVVVTNKRNWTTSPTLKFCKRNRAKVQGHHHP